MSVEGVDHESGPEIRGPLAFGSVARHDDKQEADRGDVAPGPGRILTSALGWNREGGGPFVGSSHFNHTLVS